MNNITPAESLTEIKQTTEDFFLLEGNSKDNFVYPESFSDIVGFSNDELKELPHKHYSLINETQQSEILKIVEKLLESNVTSQEKFDYEITSKDGRNYWFREYLSISESDSELKYSCLLFNISEFKKHELKLNEIIDKKTKLNDSKDKLISIISHDLRAPFSSLLGFSEILINEPNLPEEEKTEYLQYIYDASKIQLQMVNHLLDWTRLQTGTMKCDPQRLDIRDVIDNCVSVLTGSVIRKNIEIKVKGDHGFFVTADERLITQVVTNLLSNAVKFTPSGKKITVTIDLFKDNMVEVVVTDEGIGIDEKYQNKLFKIESKFSKSGTAGEKGSGLGLTLVKEIVEKHNGNIWFYSELNKGSEFHFTLPKAENNILILEEHEELQKIYSQIVEDNFSSYKVTFCKNGFEALNSLMENVPSVLITYHNMPLMNGVQLISSLRKKDIHNKVSVVVLGDEIEEKEKLNYLELSVDTFFNADLPPEELVTSLKSILV